MIEENQNRLTNLLADVEAKETRERIEKTEQIDEQHKFLADFENFCDEIIKPVMSETGTHLRSISYLSPIYYIEEQDSKMGIKYPYIQMVIKGSFRDRDLYDDDNPHIRFVGDKYTKEIQVYESNMSYLKGWQSVMKKTTYTFETLTVEVIEREIVESIEKILTRYR